MEETLLGGTFPLQPDLSVAELGAGLAIPEGRPAVKCYVGVGGPAPNESQYFADDTAATAGSSPARLRMPITSSGGYLVFCPFASHFRCVDKPRSLLFTT